MSCLKTQHAHAVPPNKPRQRRYICFTLADKLEQTLRHAPLGRSDLRWGRVALEIKEPYPHEY